VVVQLICNPQYHAFSCAIPKEDIISFAITDPALLHALAHSALSIANIGRGTSTDMAYHGCQAIRLVNKRIANSPHEAVSDATMFAVGCLTQVEVSSPPSLLSLFHYCQVVIANKLRLNRSDPDLPGASKYTSTASKLS
jgi:hypothetical protein